MESISQIDDNQYINKGYNEILKNAFNFFDNKTNNINKEIESIKDFFKFFISKGNSKKITYERINNLF